MPFLDRRRFLSHAAAAAAVTSTSRLWAAEANPTLTIQPDKAVAHVPEDFTGLSYESSQLTHTGFFSAADSGLVPFFRTLGDSGVLRIGGNMSEFTRWSPTDPTDGAEDKGTEGPDAGKGSKRTFTLSPRSIQNLNGFLEATNWKVLYGLNLAGGTAESAAEEAACVASVCGPRLLALQFGNEPDLFKHSDDPKDRWKYPEFIAKWKTFEKAVRAKVPDVQLAGPDAAFKEDWVGDFAADTKGKVCLLTSHYYAEGPPTNPDMTIDRLLTDRTKFAANVLSAVEMAKKAGMPYRMSEGNSCYNAGKKGVSDTFAAALWAGDFMAQVAALGGTGINLHGGGNGLYTPIAGSPENGFLARPDYYGMLFVRPLIGATMLQSELNAQGMNLSAYAVQREGKVTVLAFNKSAKETTLKVQLQHGRMGKTAGIIRLTAPDIDATSGVLLGGSAVAADGSWKPVSDETTACNHDVLLLTLPAYSAAAASFA